MSASPTAGRLAAMRKVMQEKELPGFLVTDLVNLGWLTGFTGSNGFALLSANDAVFATDSRYTEQAEKQCVGLRIEKLQTSAPDEIIGLLKEMGVPKIGFEADHLTFHLYTAYSEKLAPAVSLVATEGVVGGLRLIKDADEIARIEAAVEIADRTFEHILPFLKPGAVERDIMLEMEWHIRKTCGADSAFDMVVASGPRSALPHGRASTRVMEKGDFVTLDFGAKLDGYNSDITRTVVLGEPNSEQRKVHRVVWDALHRSIESIRPGASGREIDTVGRDFIADAGYGDYFGHGLGHALGRSVHDGPAFSKRSEITVATNMVATVEPGIYIPGWGGVRIEHDVVVTETGARILDRCATELLAL